MSCVAITAVALRAQCRLMDASRRHDPGRGLAEPPADSSLFFGVADAAEPPIVGPVRSTRSRTSSWSSGPLLVAASLVVVGLLIATALLQDAHQSVDVAERDRLQVQSRVVDENIGQQLDGMNRALASVRDDYLAAPGAMSALSLRLKALSDAIPGVRSMVLLDTDGTVVASSVDTLIGRDFSDRDYFRRC